MSGASRRKGIAGEAEVAAIFRAAGFHVRGLESGGDHLAVGHPGSGLVLHLESKRQETARPWQWWEQATGDAGAGIVPIVAFRRNRSRWLGLVDLEQLARLLADVRSEQLELPEQPT